MPINIRDYPCPKLATDIIIEYDNGKKEGIVLITRKNFPYGLALPGGLHELGLSAEENAQKEAREETNLEVIIETPEEPLCYQSNPNRDPRYHIVTATYIASGQGTLKAKSDAKTAALYSREELTDILQKETFAFPDHKRALEKYLQRYALNTSEKHRKKT